MALASSLAVFAAAACDNAEPTADRFEQTGELIALSGGDAGAAGACVICHGLDGEGDGNLVPRLAGMDRGYFLRQMELYSSGQRRHPQMVWIADHTDWPARQKLSDYYSELPFEPSEQPEVLAAAQCDLDIAQLYHEGDAQRDIPSCASCHGADGLGVGLGNPALAGQPAPYLTEQMRAWRQGERYGDPGNVMQKIARALDEQELEPLSAYSASLRGATSYPALPEACLRTRRRGPKNGA